MASSGCGPCTTSWPLTSRLVSRLSAFAKCWCRRTRSSGKEIKIIHPATHTRQTKQIRKDRQDRTGPERKLTDGHGYGMF